MPEHLQMDQDLCPICLFSPLHEPSYSKNSSQTAAIIHSEFSDKDCLKTMAHVDVRLTCGHSMCLTCAQNWAWQQEGIDIPGESAIIKCPCCRSACVVKIV